MSVENGDSKRYELSLEEFTDLLETSRQIRLVLQAVNINSEMPVEARPLTEARNRGFIISGENGNILTPLGASVIDNDIPDHVDIVKAVTRRSVLTSLGAASRTVDTGKLQSFVESIPDTVLEVLLNSRLRDITAREDRESSLLIDVDEPAPDSLIAKALETVEVPKRKLQLRNAIRPWADRVNNMWEALQCPQTNKIVIQYPESKLGDTTGDVILESTFENLPAIAGNPELLEIVRVDFNFLGKIDVSDIAGSSNSLSNSELALLTFDHVLTGRDHDPLTIKPTTIAGSGRRNHGKSIKDQLAPFRNQIQECQKVMSEARARGALPVMMFNSDSEGTRKLFGSMTEAMSEEELLGGIHEEAFRNLRAQPAICLSKKSVSITEDYCRKIEYREEHLPMILTDVLGMPPEEREALKLKDFASKILSIRAMSISGIQHVNHLFESIQQRFGATPTRANILEFILQTVDRLTTSQLKEIFEVCLQQGLDRVPEVCRNLIAHKFRLPVELVDRFEVLVENYNPETMGSFPKNRARRLSSERSYLDEDLESFGVDAEVNGILELFADGANAVTLIDGTHYDEDAVPGSYIHLGDRVNHSIVSRMMSGDVPDSIKNFTIVEPGGESKEGPTVSFLQLLLGGNPKTSEEAADANKLRESAIQLLNYNPDTILVLDLTREEVDSALVGDVVRVITDLGIQVLIHSTRPIPGIDNAVSLSPITEDQLVGRVKDSMPALQKRLEVTIPDNLVDKILKGVATMRTAVQDPLYLCLETLSNAATIAKAHGRTEVNGAMVSEALSFSTGTIDPKSIQHLFCSLKTLPETLKRYIFGQETIIDRVSGAIMGHLIGAGNPERPLAYLLPGPTGVGKTWIAETIHKHFSVPMLVLDGSMYKEPHSVAKLTGSPPGYVGGEEGILTEFMRDNELGMVFVDELDKAHPEVRSALMNFVDEGKMTNGNGETYARRQFIILAATNAGAEDLRPGMERQDVLQCIGKAFADENGVPKPEIAGRFNIEPMLGIHEEAFQAAIKWNLGKLGDRPAFMSLQIEVDEVDESAVELVFSECADTCRVNYTTGFGFGQRQVEGNGHAGPKYFNLREIVRSIDRLGQAAIHQLAFQELDRGGSLDRERMPIRVLAEDGVLKVESIEKSTAILA